jgi:hypothetical protein
MLQSHCTRAIYYKVCWVVRNGTFDVQDYLWPLKLDLSDDANSTIAQLVTNMQFWAIRSYIYMHVYKHTYIYLFIKTS